jgi:hypothetical protein
MTLPSGARTKNRRTPHGSVAIECTISSRDEDRPIRDEIDRRVRVLLDELAPV